MVRNKLKPLCYLSLLIPFAFSATGCGSNNQSDQARLSVLNLSHPATQLALSVHRGSSDDDGFEESLPFGQLVTPEPPKSDVWNFKVENQTLMPAEYFTYGLGKNDAYLLVLYGFNQKQSLMSFEAKPDLWTQSWYEKAKSFLGGSDVATSKHFLLQQKLLRLPKAKPDDPPKLRLAVFYPGKNEFAVEFEDQAGDFHQTPRQGFSDVSDWFKSSAGTAIFTVRHAESPAVVANGEIVLSEGSVNMIIVAGATGGDETGPTVLLHQWKNNEATLIEIGNTH